MKVILALLFFVPQILFSQENPKLIKSPADLDSIVYDISFPKVLSSELQFPFSGIEIIDSRFDTSKLGFTFDLNDKRLAYKDFKKIKLLNGVAENMRQFYNNYYKVCFNKSGDKLLIVIKNLWISNLPVSLQSEREYELEHPSLQDIYIKIEYYLHKGDKYYPLIRIDTLYQLKEENLKTQGTDFKLNDLSFFNYTIKELIEKTDFDKLVEKITDKRKFTIGEISAFNEKRFSLPILKAVKYNEGVFLTSNEFINNTPSFKNFTVNKKGKLATYGNGREKSVASWAFADSNGLHLRSAKDVEIFRTGNTFEFFSEEDIHVSRTITGNLIDVFSFIPTPGISMPPLYQPSQTRIKTMIIPRQLNMDTGEIY